MGSTSVHVAWDTDRSGGRKQKMKQAKPPKPQQVVPSSNRGFFIFMVCCALGAIVMVALLVGGEIQGARVGPDLVQKVK